uniref:Iron-binding zinc finger CDGSH type domain-containing protein n=1 Tax=Oncorhynchus kisutch TaxID=8019 RepID=A0A8C7IQ24_ONCKI
MNNQINKPKYPPNILNYCSVSVSTLQTTRSTLSTESVIASKKPFKAELVCGKRHSWCTCGHREKQPFCDGTHKAKLCGCKYTANPPLTSRNSFSLTQS